MTMIKAAKFGKTVKQVFNVYTNDFASIRAREFFFGAFKVHIISKHSEWLHSHGVLVLTTHLTRMALCKLKISPK